MGRPRIERGSRRPKRRRIADYPTGPHTPGRNRTSVLSHVRGASQPLDHRCSSTDFGESKPRSVPHRRSHDGGSRYLSQRLLGSQRASVLVPLPTERARLYSRGIRFVPIRRRAGALGPALAGAARTFLPRLSPGVADLRRSVVATAALWPRRSTIDSMDVVLCRWRQWAGYHLLTRAGDVSRIMRASHPSGRVAVAITTGGLASRDIPSGALRPKTECPRRRSRDSNPGLRRDRAVSSTGLDNLGSIALGGFEPPSRAPKARMIGQTTPQGSEGMGHTNAVDRSARSTSGVHLR